MASPAAAARGALGVSPDLKPVDIFVHGTRLLAAGDGDLRIFVAGSVTTDFIARAAAVAAAQEGFAPLVRQAPFGAWRQEALDAGSALRTGAPDIVVLATDWRDLVTDLPPRAGRAEVGAAVDAAVAGFRLVWDRLREGAPARRVVQHLPALPPARLAGVAEWRQPASPRAQMALARTALLEAGPDVIFLDIDGLAQDQAAWFGAKLPFAQEALPAYTARLRAALRQATGRMKKVLALDLDNTLWGGVIGDDGLDGLALGPGTPRGEAFAAFQDHARQLAARGVILAVCSKNDEAIAAAGFTHPHSRLARGDFAMFECGWEDKPAALRRIAAGLNVGLDSIVFADDNPAECALVRAALPEVAVVELGGEPADFCARLEAGYWFEAQHLTDEDFARGEAYQARARAADAAAAATDLQGFLCGLEMRGEIFVPAGPALARIAQLEGKTNQFNLTTRRYDEAAVADFAARPDVLLLAANLRDRFGDHGLVSSLIARREGEDLRIDSWLMSCRVFSRTLEQFMLRRLIREAAQRGASRILGEYLPTPKNAVVADLFPRLGFQRLEDGLWQRAAAAPADDLVTFITEA